MNEEITKQEILPNAIYDYGEVVAITGMSLSTVIRADRAGRLKGRKEGRRRYFFGQDIIDWLSPKKADDVAVQYPPPHFATRRSDAFTPTV